MAGLWDRSVFSTRSPLLFSGLESGDCERLGFVEDTLVETICYCDEDECNSARPASAASIGFLLAVVIFAVKALLQRDA